MIRHFSLPDGRTLAWRESGSGAPLLLLHGWGSASAVFDGLIEQLPGYRLLAPDLPGHGASCPAPAFELAALASDLLLWIDHLALERVALLGWSLGGLLALHLAAMPQGRVSRLILLASTPRFTMSDDWPHGLPDAAVRALGRDYRRDPQATLDRFHRLQFQGESLVPERATPEPEASSALAGLELLRRVDLRPLLPAIALPALVIHGERDAIIPVGAGRFLAATLPEAQLCELAGSSHAPLLSTAEAVAAALRAFLR